MIELSIPQTGEDSKNVKDIVFSILSREHPLSIMELFNRVRRNYNVNITYQAVRKAIDKLYTQDVLIKKERKYSLNKKWLLNLKTYFDTILTTYDSGKIVHSFTEELAKEDYAVYTFNNLYDLDIFWGDILVYLAKNIKKDEEKVAVDYGHYVWWLLINLGRETALYEQYKKNKIRNCFLWLRDLPLNHWGAKFYQDLGFESKVVERKDIDETTAVNVVGDTVIQVHYPKHIIKKIKTFFEKYKTTQEMSMKEITSISYEPCEVKFIIFRNPTLAKNIRDTYLKYFD